MSDTVIFIESSLSIDEAKTILPNASYKGSAIKGSILKAYNDGFRRMLLIDGGFDWTPSVWHKEILFCLNNGVAVYGGVSMGALRALELDKYGMVGMGEIYRMYASNEITGDDEVAVMKGSGTIPMVNIRKSLNNIPGYDGSIIIGKVKGIFYKHRTWSKLKEVLDAEEFDVLYGNYVDLKKEDSIGVLKEVAGLSSINQGYRSHVKTLYEKELHEMVFGLGIACSSKFKYSHEYEDRAKLVSKIFGDNEISLSLQHCAEMIKNIDEFGYEFKYDYIISHIMNFREKESLLKGDDFKEWLLKRDLLDEDHLQIFSDHLKIQKYIKINSK